MPDDKTIWISKGFRKVSVLFSFFLFILKLCTFLHLLRLQNKKQKKKSTATIILRQATNRWPPKEYMFSFFLGSLYNNCSGDTIQTCVKSVHPPSFSGPHFSAFEMNTKIYRVNLCINHNVVKHGPEKFRLLTHSESVVNNAQTITVIIKKVMLLFLSRHTL